MNIVRAAWLSMRPSQWVKNLFVFAGLLFSRNVFQADLLLTVGVAFAVFCGLSGAVYILNDLADAELDRKHPRKSARPIAAGMLSKSTALGIAAVIALVSSAGAFALGTPFAFLAMGYLFLQAAYSFFLKHVVILDVFCIAAGFVIRVIAGAVVIGVEVSSWLIVCTVLLSLFLAFSKRRHEIERLEDEGRGHSKVLAEYSTYLLDQMIGVVAASTVIAYSLYTISPETVERFGTRNLMFTIPFVLYGIFRYLYLIHRKGEGGNPETVLVSDLPLLASVALWIVTAAAIIYLPAI
jgi:4-hydroxybenzoate polyprenyltransferase